MALGLGRGQCSATAPGHTTSNGQLRASSTSAGFALAEQGRAGSCMHILAGISGLDPTLSCKTGQHELLAGCK